MKKLNLKDEQGLAGILELLVVVLVMAVVGFMIWNVHEHRQAATKTSSAVSSEPTTTTATSDTAAATASLNQASSSLDSLNQDLSSVDSVVSDKEGNLSQ